MDRTLSSKEKRERLMAAYNEREVQLEEMYKRLMKILNEHLERHERAMFEGMNYADFDPKLARSAQLLGNIIEKLTKLHIQRLEKGREQLETMSLEEQLDWLVTFVSKLPIGYRREAIDRLATKLMLKVDRRNPDGRPTANWVHPLDRP